MSRRNRCVAYFLTLVRRVDPKSVKSAKELPYMQRPGGSADDNDLEGKGLFSFFKKKKEPEPEPEEPKTNWWTL